MPRYHRLAVLMTATALMLSPAAVSIPGVGPVAAHAKGKGKGHFKRAGSAFRSFERDLNAAVRDLTGGVVKRGPARQAPAATPGPVLRNSQIVTSSLRPRLREDQDFGDAFADADDVSTTETADVNLAVMETGETEKTLIDPSTLDPDLREALTELVAERPALAASVNTQLPEVTAEAAETEDDAPLSSMLEERRIVRPAGGGPVMIH